MSLFVNNFSCNLRSGVRLGFFLPCKLSDFRFSLDQLALLVMLDLLLEVVSDYAQVLPKPEFNLYALPTYTLNLACFFLAVYLIGKLLRRDFAALQIGVMVYSFGPLSIVLDKALAHPYIQSVSYNLWLSHLFSIYVIAILGRVLYLVSGRLKWLTAAALVLMTVALSVPPVFFEKYAPFWFAEEMQDETDPYAEYRALDAEALMYSQPAILDKALAQLQPQRKKITDIFFVGFAAYATEDVFSKEVDYIKQLLEERFDTKGHSINLINHLHTLDHTPLATSTNLAITLKRIGKLMNAEEDVLLLYLTSHGSKDHQLSVSFWPLALNDITPEKLNAMIDEAGIKWRMIVISACYSGGFVKALQGPTTLVATAAAADKTSFGCGTESEFTYFGEAVFKEQLNRQSSFITALQQANVSIGQREVREKLGASMPQLSVGAAIEPKLKQLDKDMHQHQCGIAKIKLPNC
ncbi:MAG: C13 family peptidase [Methylobacter sp.]|nr:C13 family peptidase [Methylobacter sp.]